MSENQDNLKIIARAVLAIKQWRDKMMGLCGASRLLRNGPWSRDLSAQSWLLHIHRHPQAPATCFRYRLPSCWQGWAGEKRRQLSLTVKEQVAQPSVGREGWVLPAAPSPEHPSGAQIWATPPVWTPALGCSLLHLPLVILTVWSLSFLICKTGTVPISTFYF